MDYAGRTGDTLLNLEDFGRMVRLVRGEITNVPMKEIINNFRLVEVDNYYDIERHNGRRSIM